MTPPTEEMRRRIIFILHNAWVEARARSGLPDRIFELADVMENVPALLHNSTPDWVETTRQELTRYCLKYPDSRLLNLWETGVPAENEWLWLH
jgi:hypothetical protein